jgi:hypothetical protein
MPLYQRLLGFDDVPGNLRLVAACSAGYIAVVVAMLLAAVAARRARHVVLVGVVLAAAAAAATRAALSNDDWLFAARGLPVAMLVIVAVSTMDWLTARSDDGADRAALRLGLAVLALALLAKMGLHVRTIHYGFALAMPATLLLVTALVGWVPAAVAGIRGAQWAARAVAIGVLSVGIATHLTVGQWQLAQLGATLGSGNDTIRGDERAAYLQQALEEIERRVQPGQTLVVLPDGIMLNYLARRGSSLPFTQYGPLNIIMWGEDRMREAFERHPSDFVAIVYVDFSDEGARRFGRDYAQWWMTEIRERYRPVWRIGEEPFQSDRFGIVLWERIAGKADAGAVEPAAAGAAIAELSER